MLGIWQLRKIALLSSWHAMVPDFETSTDEFYREVRDSISARRIPDLEISEVEFREGGVLSARRRYLRIRRERLVFDVCSAPFGTAWFFSCRFGEIPMHLKLWEVVAMAAAAAGILAVHVALLGIVAGPVLFLLNLAAFLFLLNGLTATGLYGLDAALLRLPVLGAFYELFLRGNSYYRDDTRCMYLGTIDVLVRQAVEKFASVKPGEAVRFEENLAPTGMGIAGRILHALRLGWLGPNRG